MHITLFQVNMDRDEDRLAFCSLDTVKREAGAIPAEIYDKVFEGEIDCANLEEAYMLFNRDDRPGAKVFRSMSVSDVIAVRDPETGAETYHFCDSVGFEVVDFAPEKTTDRTNREPKTIRVVLVEPGKEARIADIEASLQGYCRAISADTIEAAYPFEEPVCLIEKWQSHLSGPSSIGWIRLSTMCGTQRKSLRNTTAKTPLCTSSTGFWNTPPTIRRRSAGSM